MDYKVLYRKYRPQNFDDLVGQDHIKRLLMTSIINEKLSHAYLFTGPRGTGKTSTAKLFAKTINCENCKNGIPCNECPACINYNESPDIIEIDAASNNGVDEIRELRENIKILPTFSKYKVYIVDEAHMLSTSAWNAFLKTLEEPPFHVIFILATTEVQKVPITVLSRCQRFDFQKIDNEIIEEYLNKIAKNEKIDITEEAISEIAKLAEGGMRDALCILDQLSKLESKIDIEVIASTFGILTTKDIDELLFTLNSGNIKDFIELIDNYQERGVDSTILLNKLLNSLLMEAINIKITRKHKYIRIIDIENLIVELESCYNRSNPYILIKTFLLKYCIEITGEQFIKIKEKSEEQQEKTQEEFDIGMVVGNSANEEKIINSISQEILLESDKEKQKNERSDESIVNPQKIKSDLIKIRINNSYVEANIDLKKEFLMQWQNFKEKLISENDLKYLPLIKDTKVEVVSPTNVILSTEYYSNSILFNEMIYEIEEKLKIELNIVKKLICLDDETWSKEKKEYMENRKSKIKVYELMSEPEVIKLNEALESAEDLFGNELIEIK